MATSQSVTSRSSPARTPTRPCMDAEPGYEDIADNIRNLDGGYLDDWEVRKALYWSLFAGAHGHTYGCNPVWQMWTPGRNQMIHARRPWYEAIHLPGSSQMQHARALLQSRPFLSRIPDQSLIASEIGEGTHHVRATRDSEGRYAMIYIPASPTIGAGRIEIDTTSLTGAQLAAWWYDPRTGVAHSLGVLDKAPLMIFAPPQGGPDWVLVLDDAACGFLAPGRG
ncbi:MAG: DUF4038 domain-containing protein [Caldilinea sp.]